MSRVGWIIGASALLIACGVYAEQAEDDMKPEASVEGIPKTFQDPAVPLIALPTTFASRRAKSEVRVSN